MHKYVLNQFLKDLLRASIPVAIGPMLINIIGGYRVECITVKAVILLTAWMTIYPYSTTKAVLCEDSMKTAVFSGLFSGIVLFLAGEIGLALNYLLLSSDRKLATVAHLFIGFWQIYLYMALFGMTYMLMYRFYRINLRR
jgi:di/tricarboxylate transporter